MWGLEFKQGLFNMTSDSGLFVCAPPADCLPLYEAKMIHQFDHRYATYEGATEANIAEGSLPQPSPEQKADPTFALRPRYWVDRWDVLERAADVPPLFVSATRNGDEKTVRTIIQDWLIGFVLNRGDQSDAIRGALGEELVRKKSMTLFGSVWSDVLDYLSNESSLRALEHRYPLTQRDLDIILDHSTRVAPTERVDMLSLARDLIEARAPRWLLGFRDVTSNVVERTAIFSALPTVAVSHKFPLVFLRSAPAPRYVACVLANVNSLIFDYVARQKVAGVSLGFFIVKQLPVLPPAAYGECDLEYIAPRVVELMYTSWDMKALAEELGHCGPPFTWNEERRAVLRAELDAYFARLYGLNRKQLRYILNPHGLSDRELENILDPWEEPSCKGPHLLPDFPTETFPGETFRVLKEKEERPVEKGGIGEYRTRRLVLEAWTRLVA